MQQVYNNQREKMTNNSTINNNINKLNYLSKNITYVLSNFKLRFTHPSRGMGR